MTLMEFSRDAETLQYRGLLVRKGFDAYVASAEGEKVITADQVIPVIADDQFPVGIFPAHPKQPVEFGELFLHRPGVGQRVPVVLAGVQARLGQIAYSFS